MPDRRTVATHYAQDSLIEHIMSGMAELRLNQDTVRVEDLGPVDEFHIGGRIATEQFLDGIAIAATDAVLDVGCGLGGTSRFVAQEYGCQVTGIDLTDEYIVVGRELCDWVGLSDQISMEQGDATGTPFPDRKFDKAFMLHVGMNIADKVTLFSEIRRVLKPGGTLGIYDIMRVGPGKLTFPLPWATAADGSSLASPDEYRHALKDSGFTVTAEYSRRDFALEFFASMKANMAKTGGRPPLGLHILMGEEAPIKLGNMIQGVSQGLIAPIEIIANAGDC